MNRKKMNRMSLLALVALVALVGLAGSFGSSSARADLLWVAPDPVLAAGTTSASYTLQIGSNSSDTVGTYGFHVQLVQTSGSGSISFGTAVEPASNYLYSGTKNVDYIGYGNVGGDASNVSGTDAALATVPTLTSGTLKNLATIPLTISAGAAGTWEVRFVADDTAAFAADFSPLTNVTPFDVGHITVEAQAVPAPLALWGGMALMGLGARWQIKRRQARKA